jgi:pyruvate,water dikinase
VPAIVGAGDATGVLRDGAVVTVSCAQGETGYVYEGAIPFDIERLDLGQLARTRTKVMLNIGNPESALALSFLPNDGVGLARLEFIIGTTIGVHPMALVHYASLEDQEARKAIDRLTAGYEDKTRYFVDTLAEGVATIAAAFYPKDVIVRMSDFKSNEYANLLGGRQFEPIEENPMIGFRGACRYDDPRYRDGFALECRAMVKVREEMGLTNVKLMIPFCRTIDEGRRVIDALARHGLRRGVNGLEIYVMCEIPSNVVLAEGFAEVFDGFSIGSNDLTQLVLGVDRDSALVSALFDERNAAVTTMIASVIRAAHAKGRKIGICGQAPSDYPEFAEFLVAQGIDSLSLNPDAVLKTHTLLARIEQPARSMATASGA